MGGAPAALPQHTLTGTTGYWLFPAGTTEQQREQMHDRYEREATHHAARFGEAEASSAGALRRKRKTDAAGKRATHAARGGEAPTKEARSSAGAPVRSASSTWATMERGSPTKGAAEQASLSAKSIGSTEPSPSPRPAGDEERARTDPSPRPPRDEEDSGGGHIPGEENTGRRTRRKRATGAGDEDLDPKIRSASSTWATVERGAAGASGEEPSPSAKGSTGASSTWATVELGSPGASGKEPSPSAKGSSTGASSTWATVERGAAGASEQASPSAKGRSTGSTEPPPSAKGRSTGSTGPSLSAKGRSTGSTGITEGEMVGVVRGE